MARVTTAQLKSILNTRIKDLSGYIEVAELVVDEQLVNKGMTEARLNKIALYLAAHYATAQEKQLKSQKWGNSGEAYEGVTGMGFDSSLYGQTALTLDTSKSLHTMGSMPATVQLL